MLEGGAYVTHSTNGKRFRVVERRIANIFASAKNAQKFIDARPQLRVLQPVIEGTPAPFETEDDAQTAEIISRMRGDILEWAERNNQPAQAEITRNEIINLAR